MWENPQHRLRTESIQIVIVMLASEQKKRCLREVNCTSLLFDIKGKKLRLGILSAVTQPVSRIVGPQSRSPDSSPDTSEN